MTGDYISTSIAANRAVTVVPVATAPTGKKLNQYMEGASLPVTGGSLPAEKLVLNGTAPRRVQTSTPTKDYHTAN
jgi:hypothetical protein